MSDMQESLKLSDFEDLVGESFIISMEGVEQTAKGVLIKAGPIDSETIPDAEREPFVLDFKFPPGSDFGQGLFQIARIGGRSYPPLFLVPRANDEDGWYMDSVIN